MSCECKPVVDEDHFTRTLSYIPDHATRGAEVYVGTIPTTNPLGDFDTDDLLVG